MMLFFPCVSNAGHARGVPRRLLKESWSNFDYFEAHNVKLIVCGHQGTCRRGEQAITFRQNSKSRLFFRFLWKYWACFDPLVCAGPKIPILPRRHLVGGSWVTCRAGRFLSRRQPDHFFGFWGTTGGSSKCCHGLSRWIFPDFFFFPCSLYMYPTCGWKRMAPQAYGEKISNVEETRHVGRRKIPPPHPWLRVWKTARFWHDFFFRVLQTQYDACSGHRRLGKKN